MRYTVESGRHIHKNGRPFIAIMRAGDTAPVEADAITHMIARLLNKPRRGKVARSKTQLEASGHKETTR